MQANRPTACGKFAEIWVNQEALLWVESMPTALPSVVHFDAYTLDLQRCELRRGEGQIELRPKAFDVLRYFVENSGRVVGKEELIGAVWPGHFVTQRSARNR